MTEREEFYWVCQLMFCFLISFGYPPVLITPVSWRFDR
jgi:hypothetical protein